MRAQELAFQASAQQSPGSGSGRMETASARLHSIYAALAKRRQHLLDPLLNGEAPIQWHHYPEDDATDRTTGYQWFYHSHSPEDRPGAVEHGHFHLFARRSLWGRRLGSKTERQFAEMTRGQPSKADTRHLLSIGLNANGLPLSLFTVNSWVTGDRMLSATLTEELLGSMRLHTGHREIDGVIESIIALCPEEIHETLDARDRSLATWTGENILTDERLEVLSETKIDIDSKLGSPQHQLP
jgi:hypothetical protein